MFCFSLLSELESAELRAFMDTMWCSALTTGLVAPEIFFSNKPIDHRVETETKADDILQNSCIPDAFLSVYVLPLM